VALQQINLKVAANIASHWRSQAKACDLTVRDWLIRQTMPAPAAAGPSAGPDLAAQLAALTDRVARLESRSPAAAAAAAPEEEPEEEEEQCQLVPRLESADGIETAELARRLGLKRGTFLARISRLGGARPGLQLDGWRCVELRKPARGGPMRAVWVPIAATHQTDCYSA
jgi:hypothetical protein